MIEEIQDKIVELISGSCFGQIQNDNNIINFNIYENNNDLFFNDKLSHVIRINLYIRNVSFENMQSINEEVTKKLVDIYNLNLTTIRIVNTKKVSSNEPNRDEKNRYYISSNFDMLVEKI